MRELDKSKVYDLSGLTSEEIKVFHDYLKENHFYNWGNESLEYFTKVTKDADQAFIFNFNKDWYLNADIKDATCNAKELFYTLKNIQVDCSELSKGQIKEMAKVFEDSGLDVDFTTIHVEDDYKYLQYVSFDAWTNELDEHKSTITYEKFMDLFGATQKEYYVLKDFGNKNTDWNEGEWQNIGGAICFGNYHSGFKYGFNSDGDYFYMERPLTKINHGKEVRKATNKEVVEVFLKEAKRRGWGVTDNYYFDFNENKFTYADCEIFNKGIWNNLASFEFDEKDRLLGINKKESDVISEILSTTDAPDISYKPTHYSKGIDTFARMEANCTKEECLAFAKGNIDKYNWRNKGQDVEDLKKIKQYADWALKIHAQK